MGPRDVMATQITSKTVQVNWNTIECIHRNGLITDYEVQLREDDSEDIVFNDMVDLDTTTSMASGLRPFTRYIFQVAGVNANGIGLFTEISFDTPEDSMSVCTIDTIPPSSQGYSTQLVCRSFILSLCNWHRCFRRQQMALNSVSTMSRRHSSVFNQSRFSTTGSILEQRQDLN